MKKLNFEWYVLNENFNRNNEIVPYNIFNNYYVNDNTNRLCVEYKTKKMSFEEFTEKLRCIIMHEEWSRCEYEIVVKSLFKDNARKVDCYEQALPNIKLIAKYVLEEYYPRLKIRLNANTMED